MLPYVGLLGHILLQPQCALLAFFGIPLDLPKECDCIGAYQNVFPYYEENDPNPEVLMNLRELGTRLLKHVDELNAV